MYIGHTMQKKEKEPIEPEMTEAEIERLKRDIYRPDMEKFRLFTEMLRRNAALKKAVIKHKSFLNLNNMPREEVQTTNDQPQTGTKSGSR